MSDLLNLIKRLKVDSEQSNKHYVYFDEETLKIHKISPRKEEGDMTFFETDTSTVEPILKGIHGLDKYSAYYDFKNKNYSIKQNEQESFANVNVLEVKPNSGTTDLTLVLGDKSIRFELDENLKDHIKKTRQHLFFVLTEKSNPYKIYSKLDFDSSVLGDDAVELQHQLSKKQLRKGVSIFTNKFFSSYKRKIAVK